MASADGDHFKAELIELTETFLDQLASCVSQAPVLLERYATGEDVVQINDRIDRLESSCDRTNQEISMLVSASSVDRLGIRLTRVHLHAGQIIDLYQHLDEIANRLEQFAAELVAIDPPRWETCLDRLGEMAEYCVTAMSSLSTAVGEFVSALCHPLQSHSITEPVSRIRHLESKSDRARTGVVEHAFRDGPSATALVYFQLAKQLDSVVDVIEDVTDRMLLMMGNRDWVRIEPTEEPA